MLTRMNILYIHSLVNILIHDKRRPTRFLGVAFPDLPDGPVSPKQVVQLCGWGVGFRFRVQGLGSGVGFRVSVSPKQVVQLCGWGVGLRFRVLGFRV
jgi:hypothetical protein